MALPDVRRLRSGGMERKSSYKTYKCNIGLAVTETTASEVGERMPQRGHLNACRSSAECVS